MNKLLKRKTKKWMMVWFIVAALSLSTLVVYAIYTRITIVKRVVSTQAGSGSLFSSDHMGASGMRVIEPVIDSTQNATIPFRVYNYVYPKEAVYRSELTQYDLIATIGTIDSANYFSALSDNAEIEDLSNYIYSITHNANSESFRFGTNGEISHRFSGCTIAAGGAYEDLFTLVFDKSEFGLTPKNYCIKLEAEPYSGDLPRLVGYVTVRFSKQAMTGWKGEVEDLDKNKINDYDGFTYFLDGNGEGTITFRWKPAYVTINKQFLNNPDNSFVGYTVGTAPEESLLTPDSEGYISLTMNVDSEEKNRYEIQFYKVDPKLDYSKQQIELVYLPATGVADWVPST